MAKAFKPDQRKALPSTFGGKSVTNHVGKGSQMLPGRGALRTLSTMPGGASLGDYASRTPSGAGAPNTYEEIEKLGES